MENSEIYSKDKNLLAEVIKAIQCSTKAREQKSISDILKEKLWKTLESKYCYVLDLTKKVDWNVFDFNKEIQLLLRSMINKDKIISLPGKNPECFQFYLTQKHGLKLPRNWGDYNFMPGAMYRNYKYNEFTFKDKKWMSEYVNVDFSVLENRDEIDSKKLKKFFYFLIAIFELYNFKESVEGIFRKEFKEDNKLKKVSHYGTLEEMKEFLVDESAYAESYKRYETGLLDFQVREQKLLREMEEYNKPFKILLKLKESK